MSNDELIALRYRVDENGEWYTGWMGCDEDRAFGVLYEAQARFGVDNAELEIKRNGKWEFWGN